MHERHRERQEGTMRTPKLTLAACAFAAGAFFALPAAAIDIMPGDYTVLPAGTNALLLYGQYSTSSELDIEGVGEIPESDFDLGLGIARYLHYNQIGGIPVAAQAFIPFGGISEARIGGVDALTDDGIGDLTVGFTAWPVSSADPEGTTVGVTAYLTMPTGAYREEPGSINLGSGTWTVTPQIGVIQGLGKGFFFDGAVDVAIRADHEENGLEFSREASLQLQAYLRYQFSAATSVSFGYSGIFGGEDKINGVATGTQTRTNQLRLFGSTFVTPTVQLHGMIGTDIDTDGGFKNDFVGMLRLMKLF